MHDMSYALRRKIILLMLFVPFPLAARCQGPQGRASDRETTSPPPATADQPAVDHTESTNNLTPSETSHSPAKETSRESIRPQTNPDGASFTFQFTVPPDKTLYYVIENNYVDRGGVPPLLSFTTYADDKRTLIQTRAPLVNGGANPPKPGEVTLQWQCDRLEVRERGLKEEVKFDSLRDSYPRAELRELGTVPGSKVVFDLNIRTGEARNRRIEHNKYTGPPTRRRLSRTTMRCAATEENLARLMDDLGPLYFPGKSVQVGETWTTTRSEAIKSFGQTHLDYRFKLDQVKETEGRKIGVISVAGESRLVPEPQQPKPPPRPRPGAATQPATSQKAPEKPREFKIDHAVCRGTIEFDFTRGELLSMDLTRELDLSATMESEEMPGLRLETGSANRLRVQVSQTPPPKPIIAGGPKPPADDPPEPATPAKRKNTANRFRKNQFPATQPARPMPIQNRRPDIGRTGTQLLNRPGTTQPSQQNSTISAHRQVGPPYVPTTSMPARRIMPPRTPLSPTSRPAGIIRGRPTPTSQPVPGPAASGSKLTTQPAGSQSGPPPASSDAKRPQPTAGVPSSQPNH